jgi:hypothetical protein
MLQQSEAEQGKPNPTEREQAARGRRDRRQSGERFDRRQVCKRFCGRHGKNSLELR